MEVSIGGDRLGSGRKQKQELYAYGRSSFNQEQDFKSSLAPGVLYPCLCIPMTNGDSMDINMDTIVRTLPTKGPLLGSFKLQVDVFSVPMRLYNATLHNNDTRIGMKMNQIYTPKLLLTAKKYYNIPAEDYVEYGKTNESSLLRYLGLSGIGIPSSAGQYPNAEKRRKINAIPLLGYYDIFKTYYSNKQEKNAYVIGVKQTEAENIILKNIVSYVSGEETESAEQGDQLELQYQLYWKKQEFRCIYDQEITYEEFLQTPIKIQNGDSDDIYDGEIGGLGKTQFIVNQDHNKPSNEWTIQIYNPIQFTVSSEVETGQYIVFFSINQAEAIEKAAILPFELANLDDMRMSILGQSAIGYEYTLGLNEHNTDWDETSGTDGTGLPYSTLFNKINQDTEWIQRHWNNYPMNGLLLKTYQADIFNNWVDTEWIEGENGISALSAVDVSDGSLKMDALNLAQKVYDMFNRIAISGGTWEDYQEVVWDENAVRKAESPVYEGGMSAEVMFEEVISTSETKIDGDYQALGSLGGRGVQVGQNGGHDLHIKAREPIFVMGIVSLTPRVCYPNGNEWYLTDLETFDDLHKPALDGIGFQDLLGERMDWRDTKLWNPAQHEYAVSRNSVGKIVAWSHYMTAVDKSYGDFALNGGKSFMVLNREYDFSEGEIQDYTSYVDPAKYNYAFANASLEAQNFWVQIHWKITTRRVMSAHQIPNL